MQAASWILQILILTAGIHVFLRFVRHTRGNPLIRGLFLSVLVGVVGLWGLATFLELEELEHILQGSTGLIVIGFAIVFQPELRRGIAQLGERSISRKEDLHGADSTSNAVQAVRALAERRHGALIAFERESSLSTIIETGSALQARVSARLLESLFHPGGALHDGAVVIRRDRVVAAGCILPLSRSDRLDASHGTRHRAAVGLAEESDAVVLVASEETGALSLASDGELTRDIPPERLEAELRRHLASNGAHRSASRRGMAFVFGVLRRDLGWLAGSLLLACGAWYAAHQSIRESQEFVVQLVDSTREKRRTPRDGEILIHPPDENMQVRTLGGNARVRLVVTGTRAQLDELGGSLRGSLEVADPDWDGGPLDLGDVRWEQRVLGVDYRWKANAPPELLVERFGSKRLQLRPGDLTVDVARADPHFQVRLDEIRFEPTSSVEIFGPTHRIQELGEGLALELEPIVLGPGDRGQVRARVRLAAPFAARGFRLAENTQVDALIDILPVEREVGTIRKEIVLVCMSVEKQDLLEAWALPPNAHTARFAIVTSGLIPVQADLSSPALLERKAAITRFVEENLRVYVDVAELPPLAEGRTAPVRWTWLRNWRDSSLAVGVEEGTLGDWQELDVRLESEASILLDPRPAPEDSETP